MVLTLSPASSVSLKPNRAVDGEGTSILFNTLAKLFIEMKIDGTRIFNMDETSFMPKTARRKVVAVCGSTNVWRKKTKPSFHMTVVGAVSAAGAAIPPLLTVPGVRPFKEDIAALSIKGSAITGAPKGFSNKNIFVQWLELVGENVDYLAKPVVFIVDNSSTHIDAANATHLFQPLDMALFKPYKDCVHDLMLERLCSINDPVVRKTNAIEMACTAYQRALINKPTSAVNGFRECAIWPLSLVELRARLVLYKGGGVKGDISTAAWLTHRDAVIDEVRKEILLLPPFDITGKKRKRTTVDVAGRLVTRELLMAGAYE
ncbi:hypothetical protein PC129_g10273 [Phytophthora cactorum]|nr:hypothetical protein PC113_g7591 [Phytophthora cactorum]KAG2934275.1 hypothetical protein PC115_g5227 [Phytophthora cactorum]KAG3218922.1 hypothetical protein PC129_g10273 [Phytophthora cactorum]